MLPKKLLIFHTELGMVLFKAFLVAIGSLIQRLRQLNQLYKLDHRMLKSNISMPRQILSNLGWYKSGREGNFYRELTYAETVFIS